ncbi:hypothetical protein CEN39_28560 [Fischerella thermalis CCMEE 5201]|jgi:hypothetical protein|nr:hypothetical protein CEN39_28560 [Fischerella thermalis CCMEE 5201]
MNSITHELNLPTQPLDVPTAILQRRSIKTFKPDPIAPDLAIVVLVPVAYAAEPRLNPGRLPFYYNIFVDRLGNPYQF